MIQKLFLSFAACVALLGMQPAQAHEFWIEPVTTRLKVDDSARLVLRVGEYFEGEVVGISAPQTTLLRQIDAGGVRDLRPLLPPTPAAEFALPLAAAGTQLVAFDSQPNQIELSADSFHAYLHDEGLDFIKARREASGQGAEPGRERYRRHVKTLLDASAGTARATRANGAAKRDATWAARTGQQLEILPLNNPLRMKPGGALRLQILFDGKPLAGALVKAWHRQSGQTLVIRTKTTDDGQATFTLPHAGGWMVSLVHMVPAPAADQAQGIDWDSFWGNLSFALPAR